MTDWRELEDFPLYSINEYGDVRNTRRQQLVRSRTNQQGCVMVSLVQGNRQFTRSVAKLVAETFLEQDPDPRFTSIIHLNGDLDDCRVTNLMWRPRRFVYFYHQMFEKMPYRVGCYIPALNKTFASLREFCTTYGLLEQSTYSDMNNGDPCYYYGWTVEKV